MKEVISEASDAPILRTQEQINQEYSSLAMLVGDREHAIQGLPKRKLQLEAEIEGYHVRMNAIQAEPVAPALAPVPSDS